MLRDFPEIGSVVEEFSIPTVREIVYQDYRIIYEFGGVEVVIFMVVHGSKKLKPHHLHGE